MKRHSHRTGAAETKLSGRRLRRRYLFSQILLGVVAAFFVLIICIGPTERDSPVGRSTVQPSSDNNRTSGVIFSSVVLAAAIWIMVRRHLDVSRRYREGDPIPPNRDNRPQAKRARVRRRVARHLALYTLGVGLVAWMSTALVSTVQENLQPTYWGTFRAYQEICGGHRTSPSICHSYGTFDSDNGQFHFLRVRFDDSNVAVGEMVRAAYTPHVVLSDASTVTSSGPSWWQVLLPGLLDILAILAMLAALFGDQKKLRAYMRGRRRFQTGHSIHPDA